MLNKKNCIKNSEVIENLYKKGKLYKDKFLVFKYKNAPMETSQFAVSVSKKIYKSAVKRNHLRRQVHEILRLNLPNFKKNIIALVIARPTCQKVTFQDLEHSINTFINTF